MEAGALVYEWLINRIRSIAATAGLFGSMCALCITLLAIAVLVVVSLIPLYLSQHGGEALGEVYCINNYTLTVGFEIPLYNTTFDDMMTNSAGYLLMGSKNNVATGNTACSGPVSLNTLQGLFTSNTCTFTLTSIISPNLNAQVFDNYALSEACYSTLQSCYYDPLLTSCLLSNCVVTNYVAPLGSASSPLTNYILSCTANIYYKTRCLDSAASYRLDYSSSQQNSACRQQRLDRINTCLNSTVQLLNVPCLISVSSGMIRTANAACTQLISPGQIIFTLTQSNGGTFGSTFSVTGSPSLTDPLFQSSFSNEMFSASDNVTGHVYRISSVNSETYASSQPGALYCGAVTHAQIASSISVAINSQNSG